MSFRDALVAHYETLASDVGGIILLLASGLAILALWRVIAYALFRNYRA